MPKTFDFCLSGGQSRPGDPFRSYSILTYGVVWSSRVEDAESFAAKLRWGRSVQGGRALAQPAATACQLAVSRRFAGQREDSMQHKLQIATAGPASFDPAEVMHAIVGFMI